MLAIPSYLHGSELGLGPYLFMNYLPHAVLISPEWQSL